MPSIDLQAIPAELPSKEHSVSPVLLASMEPQAIPAELRYGFPIAYSLARREASMEPQAIPAELRCTNSRSSHDA